MARSDWTNLILRARHGFAMIGTSQVYPVGMTGYVRLRILAGAAATNVTIREGDASGDIIHAGGGQAGNPILIPAVLFRDGLHVTVSEADAIILGTGTRGFDTSLVADPLTISAPTPPGGSFPTFNGVTFVDDFNAYPTGAGVPGTYTPLENGGTSTFSFEIMDAADPDNTDPLGGQILRCEPPAASAPAWFAMLQDELNGEAASGEVLLLTRYPPSGFDSNSDIIAAALMARVPDFTGILTFGIASTFFTAGFRNVTTTYYNNSDAPRGALGNWYFVRIRRDGTNVKARWWEQGTAEPATWRFDGAPTLPNGDKAGWFISGPHTSANGIGYDISYFAFTNDPVGSPLGVPTP